MIGELLTLSGTSRHVGSDPLLVGLRDIVVVDDPAGTVIHAVTLPRMAGLVSFALADGGPPRRLDGVSLGNGLTAGQETHVTIGTEPGGPLAIVTGVTEGAMARRLGSAGPGDYTSRVDLFAGASPADLAQVVMTGAGAAGDWVFGRAAGGGGLMRWTVRADGLWGDQRAYSAPGEKLTALARAGDVLLATTAGGPALTAWVVDARGTPVVAGQVGVQSLGIAGAHLVETVSIAGRSYAVVGAAGSGTLTVVEVGTSGALRVADHIFDGLGTRFAGVSALDARVIDGVAYVAAAGHDDGISLFRLLPGGRLLHLATFADTAQTLLADVTALALVGRPARIGILTGSDSEAGLGLVEYHVPLRGVDRLAGPAGGSLGGSALADVLTGGTGNDLLSGGAGNDILRDGGGSDRLQGGAGNDVFVLDPDGAPDTILDFTPGRDLIDLSAWSFLRSSAQLTISPTADGARLQFGDEVLRIITHDRTALTVGQVLAAGLSGLDRLLPGWLDDFVLEPPVPVADGMHGAGTLIGGGGHDRITGSGGRDTIWGGNGNDTILAGNGNDMLYGGPGADVMNGGPGSDTIYVDDPGDRFVESPRWAGRDLVIASVDVWLRRTHVEDLTLMGSADLRGIGNGLSNTIRGNDGDNILDGGKNNDTLIGGQGDDTYYIRAPGDRAIERAGEGNDTVMAFRSWQLAAHLERLILQSDRPFTAIGNGLDNEIIGNMAANTLNGREGRDILRGQGGADTFVFDRAPGPANVDRIMDFSGADRIALSGDVFGLREGQLAPAAFHRGAVAADGRDRILYDPAADVLRFDPDGTGPRPAVIIATFDGHPMLWADDFIVL